MKCAQRRNNDSIDIRLNNMRLCVEVTLVVSPAADCILLYYYYYYYSFPLPKIFIPLNHRSCEHFTLYFEKKNKSSSSSSSTTEAQSEMRVTTIIWQTLWMCGKRKVHTYRKRFGVGRWCIYLMPGWLNGRSVGWLVCINRCRVGGWTI